MAGKKSNSSPKFVLHIGSNGRPVAGAGRGIGLHFAKAYFPEAQQTVRIASAYFTLKGYDLCRNEIRLGVQIRILVGREEGESARNALVKEIWAELGRSQIPLHDAVMDLVKRIDIGEFVIRDAREIQHSHKFHCKFYISDDKYMWSGSANFTGNGLSSSGNEEQVRATSDAAEIVTFTKYYDAIMSNARDLLAELAACLKEWLGLSFPFDAYLRILYGLYGQEKSIIGPKGNHPSYFQEGVIQRAVRQAKEYDGALLLVATGLGKTVIGAETARRLTEMYTRKSILLLAPASVHDAWDVELRARNLSYHSFDTGLVFRPVSNNLTHKISRLIDCIESCDESTIVIVDEAHRYRKLLQKEEIVQKRNKRGQQKQVNRVRERLADLVHKRCKILLLTATPYGTDTQNVNSLLHILPPKAPMPNLLSNQGHWRVRNIGETAALPVVILLGIVHLLKMACQRGDIEEDGRIFVLMAQGDKRYLPKSIVLRRIGYELPFEEEVQSAFAQGAFSAEPVIVPRFNEATEVSDSLPTDVAHSTGIKAWLSSSREMSRFVRVCWETPDRLMNGHQTTMKEMFFPEEEVLAEQDVDRIGEAASGGKFRFNMSQNERQRILTSLRAKLDGLPFEQENKFVRLSEMLLGHTEQSHKIIIFVKRYSTGYCLAEAINRVHPHLIVSCTVRRGKLNSKNGSEYDLENMDKRRTIIKRFSPVSNGLHERYRRENVNILICTDADGVGLNMQDACVVVNYDLPAGADELFQRAGRVLRMTADRNRTLYLYTFAPDLKDKIQIAGRLVQHQIDNLIERHNRSRDLIGGSILSDTPQEIFLATPQDISDFAVSLDALEDEMRSEPDPTLRHIAMLEKFRDRAAGLPLTMHSAKNFDGKDPLIAVLLEGENKSHVILYNLATEQLEKMSEDEILNLIQCEEGEGKASVSAKIVEAAAIEAAQAWYDEADVAFDVNATRLCAVYLKPPEEPERAFKRIFRKKR